MRHVLAALGLALTLAACPAAPAVQPSLAGTWRGTLVSSGDQATYHVELVATDAAGTLGGSLRFCHANFSCDAEARTITGTRDGASATWQATGSDGDVITGAGTVAGRSFAGTFEAEKAGKFSLTRAQTDQPLPFQ